MADRLRSRAATAGKTGRLPKRSTLGAWLGGDEAAQAEYAYRRLQEAFARPLPLPMHDARFGYGNSGAAYKGHLSEGDQDVGGLLGDYFARVPGAASRRSRLSRHLGRAETASPEYADERVQTAFAEPTQRARNEDEDGPTLEGDEPAYAAGAAEVISEERSRQSNSSKGDRRM